MKIIKLAALAAFGTTLLTGCGVEPGEVQADSKDEALPAALDGRAAAAVEGVRGMALSPGLMGLTSSWYSGSVSPGATQHWYWNNSSLTGAFKVGLSPTGASTTSACQFEVSRSWDVQQYGGEREFHFTIKNTGSIACGTNILLGWQDRSNTWATGGIDVGASKSWTWNNANPLTASHFVGVSPSGSTSTTPCELEVTRSWYIQQPGGEREFHFTVTNVGAIACQGDIQLVTVTNANSSWATGSLTPGTSKSWTWNNANPLDRVYATGLSPAGAVGSSTCQLEVTGSHYRQVINSDGTAEREYVLTVQNVGSLTCSGTVLHNYL
ncbi:hypothetical protein [Vitiosangium sp. GDMCC 1.1324]|uniref:hypothetical protein n=1 Tax=Vitiosangium sp. (strain GDMCC 1.1324) TaxID=2138576 RepID=UPI000D3D3DAF|nr:hypothetical protein [Vitiosangium sp. GDMCC 1.1324]PTL84780.1 hypothetical protein DAT35_06880 [Vitiosangium sp. GDMCC 1.1324]